MDQTLILMLQTKRNFSLADDKFTLCQIALQVLKLPQESMQDQMTSCLQAENPSNARL